MKKHKTIYDDDFKIEKEDKMFNFQKDLTVKLDKLDGTLNQNIINEIVLWKVNRYAEINKYTLNLINSVDANSKTLDEELTRNILKELINTKGIRLPMASSILRFKNKKIYQIIDQRVYRIIYKDETLELANHLNDKNIEIQINIYLKYLKDLRIACEELKIPFSQADRILYMADKRINKDIKLRNYQK